MSLTKLEREVLTDSMLKVQSIQASLRQIDKKKVPHSDDLQECLEEADHSFRHALNESEPT